MMRAMLIVMGIYLAGCYAYGVYLLIKVYTGRRMNRQSVALSRRDQGLVLNDRPSSSVAPTQHEPEHKQARAA
ncbi:MAG: hypothetical protein ACIAXF_09015 [Phycisphaerales bacterium JB063]